MKSKLDGTRRKSIIETCYKENRIQHNYKMNRERLLYSGRRQPPNNVFNETIIFILF